MPIQGDRIGLETKVESILTEENALKVLSSISKHGESKPIEPLSHQGSKVGYYYPQIAQALGCRPGEEIRLLEWLSDLGCLSKQMCDQLDLCPFCLGADLRFRRLCPSCHSKHIARKDVVHHFRCGWTGLEENAVEETILLCPKCHRQMRHFGIDYDRSSSYHCLSCNKIFAQPEEVFECNQCSRRVPKGETILTPIFIYWITPQGMDVAKEGSLSGITVRREIIESSYNLYTLKHIEDRIEELVMRYHRYQAGFSIVMIRLKLFETLLSEKGVAKANQMMKIISSTLAGETRKLDLPGLYDDHTFIVVLPQTLQKGAQVFARRLLNCIRNLPSAEHLRGITTAIAVATCPDDGIERDTLIKALKNRLARAEALDGDSIICDN